MQKTEDHRQRLPECLASIRGTTSGGSIKMKIQQGKCLLGRWRPGPNVDWCGYCAQCPRMDKGVYEGLSRYIKQGVKQSELGSPGRWAKRGPRSRSMIGRYCCPFPPKTYQIHHFATNAHTVRNFIFLGGFPPVSQTMGRAENVSISQIFFFILNTRREKGMQARQEAVPEPPRKRNQQVDTCQFDQPALVHPWQVWFWWAPQSAPSNKQAALTRI